jgi:hypothetical protein
MAARTRRRRRRTTTSDLLESRDGPGGRAAGGGAQSVGNSAPDCPARCCYRSCCHCTPAHAKNTSRSLARGLHLRVRVPVRGRSSLASAPDRKRPNHTHLAGWPARPGGQSPAADPRTAARRSEADPPETRPQPARYIPYVLGPTRREPTLVRSTRAAPACTLRPPDKTSASTDLLQGDNNTSAGA